MRTIAFSAFALLLALPAFGQQQINLTSQVRGTLPVTNGGIGVATLTGLALGNGTSAFSAYTGTACTNQALYSLSAAGVGSCLSAALTKTDDTNVTLTLGGSPTNALLNATSLTVGWTGTLGLSRGGTNANLSATGGTSQVLKQVSSGAAITVGQLACADLSTAGTACTAASSSFATAAQGTKADNAGAVTGAIKSNGSASFSQAACADLSNGSTGCSMSTTAGGDLTGTLPSPTLASIITAGGPTGSATVAPIITYDAKGRLTAVSSATVTPAVGSITGLGTGVATALAVNVGSAGAPVTFNGAGGTPSSIVLTNASGTAASLTAGTATNLSGGTVSATTIAASSTITPAQVAGIVGTTTNNSAQAGSVGEFVENSTTGNTFTNTAANYASISLTAGDWDVSAAATSLGSLTNSWMRLGVSQTSATFTGSVGKDSVYAYLSGGSVGAAAIPRVRTLLSGTTTIYLVVQMDSGNTAANGGAYISARRIR